MRPSFLRSVSVKALIISALIMSAVVVAVVYAKTLVHQPERDRHGNDSADRPACVGFWWCQDERQHRHADGGKAGVSTDSGGTGDTGPITHHHYVPGRLAYDDNRHIDVKSPTSGIVTEVLVKPGDVVRRETCSSS